MDPESPVSQIDTSPIFLIGAARSGTKFARSILNASNCATAIEYDVNYIWRYGNENIEHDELDPSSVTSKIRSYISSQLYRLAKITPEGGEVLIEKTVSNTLRVLFIEAVFPNARYVHLIRDGRAVTESALRLWQAPPDTGSLVKKLRQIPLSSVGYIFWFGFNYLKGIATGRRGGKVWGPRYKGLSKEVDGGMPLIEICARQWQRSVEKACAGLKQIPPDRVFTLRYEDLVQNENRIRELLNFVQFDDQERVLEHYRKTVCAGNDDKWREKFDDEELRKIMNIIEPTLKQLGFLDNEDQMTNETGS